MNDAGPASPRDAAARFLAAYDPAHFPAVALSVDLVVLTMARGAVHLLVIERGEEPFRGVLALPGGFVRPDEDALAAAHRELAEETGLSLAALGGTVEQLATFTAPRRDPRMRVVSVAHLVLLAAPDGELPPLQGGSDAAAARWIPAEQALAGDLAFDHAQILAAACERLAGKMEYTTIAAALLPPAFTLSALREVYEAVWRTSLPAGNFTRKMQRSLTPTGHKLHSVGAPASLFTVGSRWISPPLQRAQPERTLGAGHAP